MGRLTSARTPGPRSGWLDAERAGRPLSWGDGRGGPRGEEERYAGPRGARALWPTASGVSSRSRFRSSKRPSVPAPRLPAWETAPGRWRDWGGGRAPRPRPPGARRSAAGRRGGARTARTHERAHSAHTPGARPGRGGGEESQSECLKIERQAEQRETTEAGGGERERRARGGQARTRAARRAGRGGRRRPSALLRTRRCRKRALIDSCAIPKRQGEDADRLVGLDARPACRVPAPLCAPPEPRRLPAAQAEAPGGAPGPAAPAGGRSPGSPCTATRS